MDFVRLDAAMKALLSLAKPQAAHGYVIDFKTRKTQTSNVQQLPERVFLKQRLISSISCIKEQKWRHLSATAA